MRPQIGIIGAGVIGTFHGKAIHHCLKSGLIEGDLNGICDADAGRRESYARVSGASLVTGNAEELIASPRVNTVYVCTPTVYHKDLSLRVLAAGKALFCEKPLAFHAADAAIIRDAAKLAGVTHQVGLVMRFSPVINVMRDLIRDPAAGRTMAAVMIDDQYFPIQGHYQSTWRGDKALVGAGTLLEHAIHDVDILVNYFGRVRRVYGVTRNFFEKDGVEDVSSAMLEFEHGVVVNHVSIWHNLLHRGSSRRMNVICENAQFSWQDDDWTAPIRCESNATGGREDVTDVLQRYLDAQGITDERLSLGAASHSLEDYNFLKAVSEERQSQPDFDVALYAHEVVDAIYKSASEGRPVDMAAVPAA